VGLALGTALGAGATVLTGSPLLALAGALVGLLLPRLYLLYRKARRVRAFEEQLPDAIDLLSRAIRAGHAVSNGLRLVAEESPDPVASEFRRVFEEQKFGLPFDESLLALSRRVDLVDLRVMVVAILVQREVGGNLTEILDKISSLVRARFTLRRQLRVHTAQGKLSGYVLSLLPVGVGLVLAALDPSYMALLYQDALGRFVLGSALTLQLFGYLWIWRILKLDI
jgi:tight adherence protein B